MSMIDELKAEKATLEKRLRWVNEGLQHLGEPAPIETRQQRRARRKGHHNDKGKMSAATRKKLSIATKARWARLKASELKS
jgi:hypothetical protein